MLWAYLFVIASTLASAIAAPAFGKVELEKKFYERNVTYKVHPDFKERARMIQDHIHDDNILLDYLNRFFPAGELYVEYPYGGGYPVSYGNYISPLYTIEQPSITFQSFFPWSSHFAKDRYTLALTDVASNGQENARAVWINLKIDMDNVSMKEGSNKTTPTIPNNYFLVDLDLEDGKALVPYAGPSPANGTGQHEYVFIMFRQSLGDLPYHHLKQRLNWGTNITGHGIQDWASYYALQPIAVNYFNSSNENLF